MLKWIAQRVLLAAVFVVSVFGDQAPITVSIASPSSAVVKVTTPTISVSGTASGGGGITKVTWQTSNGATGVASGLTTWTATGIPVTDGTTTIVLRACDSKGGSSWLALVAVRP